MTDPSVQPGDELGRSFIRLLIGDVLAARQRLATEDTQRHRRETVRATFAAIDGVTWLYREHVRHVAKDMGVLTPIADLALRERTFTVSNEGVIIEQDRFVTLRTILRLTTRQARLIEPSVAIDMSGSGWAALKSAIDVRNRVTHPKSQADMQVATDELDVVASGLALAARRNRNRDGGDQRFVPRPHRGAPRHHGGAQARRWCGDRGLSRRHCAGR